MTPSSDELKKQIEAAYDYRGHVTITFKDGKNVEGFVFNRDFSENPFIEVFLKGSGDKALFLIKNLSAIALTGVDEAAGKSYQNWVDKQSKKESNN
jgi:hypothetical protein